jgi:hypothetical protein
MKGPRTVLWRHGNGSSRLSCGVARTADGFVVDVQRGDACVKTEQFTTREAAVRRALALEHDRRRTARGVRRPPK